MSAESKSKSNTLTPKLLDDMIANDFKLHFHRYETYYDGSKQKSPEDIVANKLNYLFTSASGVSEPLKKMHSLYLTRVAKDCYPDKHVQGEWANLEQIELCKKMTKHSIFGDFEESLHRARTRDANKLQKCLHDAANQMETAVG